jgi:very-short-patch-repair endonuclease
MGSALKRWGISATPQYPVKRRIRGYYYLDFAIPGSLVAIECDGAAYHSTPAQKARDKRRQVELESLGWTVLRFSGSQINGDIDQCEHVIRQVLSNPR